MSAREKITKEFKIIAVLSSTKSEATSYHTNIGNEHVKILSMSLLNLSCFRVMKNMKYFKIEINILIGKYHLTND
jgi:hypothetical protein